RVVEVWFSSALPAGHEAFECFRQACEIRQLRGSWQRACLAEPVDPYRGEAKLLGRGDVVEQAGGDVDVPAGLGLGTLEKALPVPCRGFVGASFGGGDMQIDRHSDLFDRRGQEI